MITNRIGSWLSSSVLLKKKNCDIHNQAPTSPVFFIARVCGHESRLSHKVRRDEAVGIECFHVTWRHGGVPRQRNGSQGIKIYSDANALFCFGKKTCPLITRVKTLNWRSSVAAMHLFSLWVLFSHFRPRDILMGVLLTFLDVSFISYAYVCTCIRRSVKATIP